MRNRLTLAVAGVLALATPAPGQSTVIIGISDSKDMLPFGTLATREPGMNAFAGRYQQNDFGRAFPDRGLLSGIASSQVNPGKRLGRNAILACVDTPPVGSIIPARL